MTLCGQTKLQLPHWMHRSGSHVATRSEMLRFSKAVVPLGYVPSTGSALTGSWSPRPSIIAAVTVRTKSGACAGTVGGRSRVAVTRLGTSTRCSADSVWSTAAWLRATTSAPRRAYVLPIAALTAVTASSRGSTPEMAKKHVCSTVLVRPASPASRATRSASMV